MATRRALIGQIALGLGVLACRGALAQPAESAAYVGIETSARTGTSRARFFSASGATTATAPLDFRAHGMARHGPCLIVFPRRPGTHFAVIDQTTLDIGPVIVAPEGRHFFGHGAFSRDGRVLLVTENDLETLGGAIGLYEVPGFRRLGTLELPGPGPHEIVRDPVRDVFHVALGGLETHPDYGRMPLNLSEFRSQIVTIDLSRMEISPRGYWPGTEGVSLRHLAVDGSGRLIIGGQLADPSRAMGASVLWLCDDDDARPLDTGAALKGYVSSVASHGSQAWVTSKSGNLALRLVDGSVTRSYSLTGASAVAAGPGLDALSGYGVLRLNGTEIPVSDGYEYDNHGLAVL